MVVTANQIAAILGDAEAGARGAAHFHILRRDFITDPVALHGDRFAGLELAGQLQLIQATQQLADHGVALAVLLPQLFREGEDFDIDQITRASAKVIALTLSSSKTRFDSRSRLARSSGVRVRTTTCASG